MHSRSEIKDIRNGANQVSNVSTEKVNFSRFSSKEKLYHVGVVISEQSQTARLM